MNLYPEKYHYKGEEKTVWRLEYRVMGQRHRRTFTTREEGMKWSRLNQNIARQEGQKLFDRWASIDEDQRRDILAALELLPKNAGNGQQVPLTEAVGYYLKNAKPDGGTITLQEALKLYLKEKARKSSSDYPKILGQCLEKFSRDFTARNVHEIKRDEIKKWLHKDKNWSADTFNHYRGYLKAFFSWCKEEKRLTENPAESIDKAKKEVDREIVVPPPVDVIKIFKVAAENPDWGITEVLALGFGFGLRVAEIKRLEWSDINTDQKTIKVQAKKAKTGARRVIDASDPIFEKFWSILIKNKKDSGLIAPTNLIGRMRKLKATTGLDIGKNSARHSFASYHYAHTQKDFLTRQILGHIGEPQMFIQYYRAVDILEGGKIRNLTKTDAKAYWNLRLEQST